MNIGFEVEKLVSRLAGTPICDSCIAERLKLADIDVERSTRELAGRGGFERRVDACGICCERRSVTSRGR